MYILVGAGADATCRVVIKLGVAASRTNEYPALFVIALYVTYAVHVGDGEKARSLIKSDFN